MLESGGFATIGDLAAPERIAPSYMTRVMWMTILAPEIVAAIVEGRASPGLAELLARFRRSGKRKWIPYVKGPLRAFGRRSRAVVRPSQTGR